MKKLKYTDFSILDLSHNIKCGKISPVDLTQFCLSRIEKYNSLVNSFITILKKEAFENAYYMEKEIKKGKYRGKLHGIPYSIKDNISANQIRSTKGSQIFSNYISNYNSVVVKKLSKAGAILLGTNNLNEFASGIDGKNIFYGDTKNPWDLKRISGGSSGGSAVAVATGMVFFSIGTDTGGSIRVPASLCGIIGFKPTYDVISRIGIFDLSPTLDHVGILTRNISDCNLIFNTLCNRQNIRSLNNTCKSFSDNKRIILGIPKINFVDYLESEVRKTFCRFIKRLRLLNLNLSNLDISLTNHTIYKSWLSIRLYETWKTHIHIMDKYNKLYSPDVRKMILEGKNISEETYQYALNTIESIKKYFAKIFNEVDLILTPTTIISAPKSEITRLKIRNRSIKLRNALLQNTILFNSMGFPAITLPIGLNRFTNMPIGLQIIGKQYYDKIVLNFSHYVEKSMKLNKIIQWVD